MFKKIKAPKYKIGRYSLNEYELRQVQVDIAEGKLKDGIIVKDQNGNKATINKDGTLSNKLHGIDICGLLTLRLLAIKREKKQS